MSEELRSLLAEIEEEVGGFGGSGLEDGVKHVRLEADRSGTDGKDDYYRFAWVVACGEEKGRHAAQFARWAARNPEGQSKMRKIFWAQTIAPLLDYIPESRSSEMTAGMNALRMADTNEDFQEAAESIAQAVDGVDVYVKQSTKTTNKVDADGVEHTYTNVNITTVASDKAEATCACVPVTI